MTDTLRDQLVLVFGGALCACLGFWRVWRRWLEGMSASAFARRGFACAYWLLALTVVSDILASLKLQPDDTTPGQFTVLFLIGAGMMLQMALTAFVLAPVAMRFSRRPCSLAKTLLILESGAFLSMLIWAIGLVAFVRAYRQLLSD
ncbi:MAG TPA: hypothetical protein VGO59_09485 [Verrucomicrobiae bacterium]